MPLTIFHEMLAQERARIGHQSCGSSVLPAMPCSAQRRGQATRVVGDVHALRKVSFGSYSSSAGAGKEVAAATSIVPNPCAFVQRVPNFAVRRRRYATTCGLSVPEYAQTSAAAPLTSAVAYDVPCGEAVPGAAPMFAVARSSKLPGASTSSCALRGGVQPVLRVADGERVLVLGRTAGVRRLLLVRRRRDDQRLVLDQPRVAPRPDARGVERQVDDDGLVLRDPVQVGEGAADAAQVGAAARGPHEDDGREGRDADVALRAAVRGCCGEGRDEGAVVIRREVADDVRRRGRARAAVQAVGAVGADQVGEVAAVLRDDAGVDERDLGVRQRRAAGRPSRRASRSPAATSPTRSRRRAASRRRGLRRRARRAQPRRRRARPGDGADPLLPSYGEAVGATACQTPHRRRDEREPV